MKLLPTINYSSKKCKVFIKSKSFRLFENSIFNALKTFEQIKKRAYSPEKEEDVRIMILLNRFPNSVLSYLMFKNPNLFRSPQKRDLVMKAIDVAIDICHAGLRLHHRKSYGYYDNLYETMRAVLTSLRGIYEKKTVNFRLRDFPNGLSTVERSNMYFRCLVGFAHESLAYGRDEISETCNGRAYLMHLNQKYEDLRDDLGQLRNYMIQSREVIAWRDVFPVMFDSSYGGNTFRFVNFEKGMEAELREYYTVPKELSGQAAALKMAQNEAYIKIEMDKWISSNNQMFSILLFHTIQIRWVYVNIVSLMYKWLSKRPLGAKDASMNYASDRRRRLLDLGYEEPSLEECKQNLARNIAMMEMEHGETN